MLKTSMFSAGDWFQYALLMFNFDHAIRQLRTGACSIVNGDIKISAGRIRLVLHS